MIDFDGVISDYVGGWIRADLISPEDKPIGGAFEHIIKLMDAGFYVVIFSVRCNVMSGQGAIRRWLKRHGFPEDYLRKIKFAPGKPQMHVLLDDRAIGFNGNWAQAAESIQAFEPWYYKERGRGR